ncbi:mannosyl-3-phosphoglycerate phosphatase [Enterobacter cancerogenus]|uniref:Mannosyl-3-phosphoglycerate phosphatase n=1 Tax=Enterobacter cancerogenus TaxID=69218 RepID=A0A484YD84_9ENTR|nr:mannosyl-3-phosphoglycerate phosphatase [Enterobacter cancerogenus]
MTGSLQSHGWRRCATVKSPVVLCSSKTAAEMTDIQRELGLDGLPLIAENGAVIQPDVRWEDTSRSLSGMAHQDIAQCLARIRASRQYKFTTFDDVDVQTIGEWTGLTRLRATLACKHEASRDLNLARQRRTDGAI